MGHPYTYHSLEDFLTAHESHVDGQLNDGWGASFPVKGREIRASVLFADIAGFSARTLHLSPAETLVFVNNFFAWITAEALNGRPGIVDKYIGDEIMIVFAEEFGSADPFADAIHAARMMSDNDYLAFNPHIGIATGEVIVGYVGTPMKYSASVFGAPVALAARCAGVRPPRDAYVSSSIVFPAGDWAGHEFADLFPPRRYLGPDGRTLEQPSTWRLQEPRSVDMKNLGEVPVREAYNASMKFPDQDATERAREGLRMLRDAGRYWPYREMAT